MQFLFNFSQFVVFYLLEGGVKIWGVTWLVKSKMLLCILNLEGYFAYLSKRLVKGRLISFYFSGVATRSGGSGTIIETMGVKNISFLVKFLHFVVLWMLNISSISTWNHLAFFSSTLTRFLQSISPGIFLRKLAKI